MQTLELLKTAALLSLVLCFPASAATLKMAYDADPVSMDPHEQLAGGTLQLSHIRR
jgi:peptide/nickel transport system substrate-binding protein